MLESWIRPFYDRWLVIPVAKRLCRLTIRPNTVTLLAGVSGILAAVAVGLFWPFLAIFLLAVSGYLDSLDGSLARLQQRQSAWGAVLDIVVDRIVEISLLFALFLFEPHARALSSLLLFR